jgi:hypothetical protein
MESVLQRRQRLVRFLLLLSDAVEELSSSANFGERGSWDPHKGPKEIGDIFFKALNTQLERHAPIFL